MAKKSDQNHSLAIVAMVGIIAVAGLLILYSGANITGAAVTNSGQGKTANTACARDCTVTCVPDAVLPIGEDGELSIHDCVLQCMNALCSGQTSRAGKCDAWAADECCNVFAEPGQDPDCATCVPDVKRCNFNSDCSPSNICQLGNCVCP